MSSYQLAEWQAYFDIHPFGHDVDQQIAAMIGAAVANAGGGYKPPKQPKDFLPQRQQTPEEMQAVVKQVLGGHC